MNQTFTLDELDERVEQHNKWYCRTWRSVKRFVGPRDIPWILLLVLVFALWTAVILA